VLEVGRLGPLDWAVAGKPLAGEPTSGDDWMVLESDGQALIGVVDGLGHGAAAADAAQVAIRVVTEHRDEPLDALFELSHRVLRATRGAAMTLARISRDDGSLAWLGVGNVGGYVVRVGAAGSVVADQAMLRGGILGVRLPSPLNVRKTVMLPGDLLLMGTDGLSAGFEQSADLSRPTAQVASDIIDHCAKSTDDALILAVRNRRTPR
jgi:negative regulator of sigma-B (phosphoserine phosphatase)